MKTTNNKEKGKPEKNKQEKPKMPYLNRELSWLDFNSRVLEEAFKKENPIFERLRFLAITASNLDEFFMVRVAGVMEQVRSKYTTPDLSGLTPQQLLSSLREKIAQFMEKQYSCFNRSILPVLRNKGFTFVDPEELTEEQKLFLQRYFTKVLFPHALQQKPQYCGTAGRKQRRTVFRCRSGSRYSASVFGNSNGGRIQAGLFPSRGCHRYDASRAL